MAEDKSKGAANSKPGKLTTYNVPVPNRISGNTNQRERPSVRDTLKPPPGGKNKPR